MRNTHMFAYFKSVDTGLQSLHADTSQLHADRLHLPCAHILIPAPAAFSGLSTDCLMTRLCFVTPKSAREGPTLYYPCHPLRLRVMAPARL